MTIKEFGECIEYNIEHNLKHALLGLGAPGVGKSQLVKQIGDKYGMKVIDIRLAQMSEVEIGGLIYPNESRTKTVWLAPEILPNEERDGKNTILLLDEITSCSKRVQVAAYQLILDRRIGEYHLPEGTFVVALGNREDDDGVYIQLAGPLADRFEIHYIETDFEGWKYDFAIPHNVHPFVIQYLTSKPAALHTQELDGENMVFATPRSWVRVSDILLFDDDITKTVIQNKIIGNIGAREGRQFIAYCKENAGKKLVTPDSFLEGLSGAPKEPEKVRLLIDGLLTKVTFLNGVTEVESLEEGQRKVLERVLDRSFDLPTGEYTIFLIKKILDMNREVVKQVFLELDSPKITKFIQENGALVGIGNANVENKSQKNGWLDVILNKKNG